MVYLNKSFSIFLILVSFLCILNITFKFILKPIYLKKKVQNQLIKTAKSLNQTCLFLKCNEASASFKLKIQEKIFIVKILDIKKNCELQINNIDTFIVYNHVYKENCKLKKIPNISNFMKSNQTNRIIILSNQAKNIKKVINECEMIIVNPNVDVYGTHIFNFNQCSYLFDKKI